MPAVGREQERNPVVLAGLVNHLAKDPKLVMCIDFNVSALSLTKLETTHFIVLLGIAACSIGFHVHLSPLQGEKED